MFSLPPNCTSISFSFHIIPPEILLNVIPSSNSTRHCVTLVGWPALLAQFICTSSRSSSAHISSTLHYSRKKTYRAPAVEAVWASLRAAVPLIMVETTDSMRATTKKVMRWLGEVPDFGGTTKTSGAEPPTNAARGLWYKRYSHFQPTNIWERKHQNYRIGIQFLA